MTLEESSNEENGEQKETEPTEDHEEDEVTDERQAQGQHGGKEWEAGVEAEGEHATGDEESRGGGKTGEERQQEDTEHLQDIGKDQRESGFAEMTEEEREETKASKPQELLPKDLFRILRIALSGAKTIGDITGIAARYQAAIESSPVTVRLNIENITVDTDAASWLPDDAPQMSVSDDIWDTGPLAFELVIHIDSDLLQLGHHVGDDLPKHYTMYSEQYLDQVLTPVAIKRILSRETEQISKPGSYGGM